MELTVAASYHHNNDHFSPHYYRGNDLPLISRIRTYLYSGEDLKIIFVWSFNQYWNTAYNMYLYICGLCSEKLCYAYLLMTKHQLGYILYFLDEGYLLFFYFIWFAIRFVLIYLIFVSGSSSTVDPYN